jgi:uncharacterized protein
MWRKIIRWVLGIKASDAPISVVPKGNVIGLRRALAKANASNPTKYHYPVQAPQLLPAVVPQGEKSGIAMDSNFAQFPVSMHGGAAGFPGYPHLSFLATRAEYRAMASALSLELTREWITLNSTETAGDKTKEKITELTKKIEDIGLQQVIQRAVEHDALFGRAQILIDIKGHDLTTPLTLSPKTIAKDSFNKVTTVEAIWTTPAGYNAINPAAPDFYKPSKWFMLGKEVHASRLMTIITRPVPDMLKPAFNFGGMSLSQLAEPYVDNWLRTRQSVSDLINNFSITALATSMDQVLTASGSDEADADAGENLFNRASLFTAMRSNNGLMLLDKEREELVQVNTPLSGLHELQAQSQEHMCSVSKTPSTILLGVAPAGFGNVAEGEIEAWEKWVAGLQESDYRQPIHTVLCVLQLSMYGEIDPDITFTFTPLSQMTKKELAEIRQADATTAQIYATVVGAIDPMEVRERLARDPDSGYQGLDLNKEMELPDDGEDDEDNEGDK